jgi:hypothetical protein
MAPLESSPAFAGFSFPSTVSRKKNTIGTRSSPRTRGGALLGPKNDGRSSRRAAACSAFGLGQQEVLGHGFYGEDKKTTRGVVASSFIGSDTRGKEQPRGNPDRISFRSSPD